MGKMPDVWTQYKQDIIDKLDILGEWKRLADLRIVNDRPTAKGWVKCHAIGREDRSASAGVCVEGEMKGCYRDWGSADLRTTDIFRYAARLTFAGDYRKALDFYAKQVGVAKPTSKNTSSKIETLAYGESVTLGQLMLYTDHKPGIIAEAITDVGAVAGSYPINWRLESRTRVFAVPMYRSKDLLEGAVSAYHIASIDPRAMIRKFEGKNNPVSSHKTLTLGDYGLMNVAGLKKLPSAKVVWIVEGFSDLLAVQGLIRDRDDHVVLSAGSCTYYPLPEWPDLFAGKTVYICFDVGDPDDAGQKGARVWCTMLAPAVREIKNVALPPRTEDGKNDLRDWIYIGEKTYDDMLTLAAEAKTFIAQASGPSQPSNAGAVSSSLTPEQAILDRLGCVVCGILQGSGFIEAYSIINGTSYVIRSLNSFSVYDAVVAFGLTAVNAVISQEREPPPGKVSIGDVRKAIGAIASGNIITDGDSVGAGVWEIKDDIVLIGKAVAHCYTPDKRIVAINTPVHRDKRIDFTSNTIWYDEQKLTEMLRSAENLAWRRQVVDDLLELFARWDNWSLPSSVEIGAGMTLATWVQTLWNFRPHVCISGPSDCGKTTFINRAMTGMFNGLCAAMQKTTEAGLRQKIRNTGMILAIDEFEGDDNRQKVLELLRTSTRGGTMPRGTSSGKSQEYGLKHIAWVGGIEVGLHEGADKNRFIGLDLDGVDLSNTERKKLTLPSTAYLHELGERSAAVAIWSIRAARAMAEQIPAVVRIEGVDTRYVESFAVPAAMLAVNMGGTLENACENVRAWIEERGIKEHKVSDEDEILDAISNSKIAENGKMYTVSYLLSVCKADVACGAFSLDLDPNSPVRGADADRMLQANGIRYFREDGTVAVHPPQVRRFLLANTRFSNKDLGQLLKRVVGAVKSRQKVASKTAVVYIVPDNGFI